MKTQRAIAGRFRIEKVLGEGAFCVVYAARDLVLDREVAVKIPRASAVSRGTAERIAEEARAAARLNDPHVVTIYDVVEQDAQPAIVMERIDGESLAHLIERRGTLPLDETLRIGEGIALGLAHAHRAGIVHRDLKPSNVLIDSARTVKLTDFGLASEGTPFYLAPEVAAGGEPTPASDLFALGVILERMLGEKTPVQIKALVARLLAVEPRERPARAAAVAEELAGWRAQLQTDPLFAPTVTIARAPAAASKAKRLALPRFNLKPVIPFALSALALAALLALGFSALRPRDVTVPKFSSNFALAATQAQHLGLLVRRTTAASQTVPSGSILSQAPAAGTHVAPGSEVRLVVSTGPPLVAVPDLVGRDLNDAKALVAVKNLRLTATSVYADSLPNTIVEQSPAPGTNLRETGVVQALVSKGPSPETILRWFTGQPPDAPPPDAPPPRPHHGDRGDSGD